MGFYPLSYSLATSVKASWVGPTLPRKKWKWREILSYPIAPPPLLPRDIHEKKGKESEFVSFFHSFFPQMIFAKTWGGGIRIFPFRKPGLVSFVRGSRFQVEKLLHEYSGAVEREERGIPWFSTS